MERRPENFIGDIRPLLVADLPAIERILQGWVRDSPSSPSLDAEISEYLARMAGSLRGGNGYRYLVAVTLDGGVVGVVGMRPPSSEMLGFAATERPVEMINAYVETGHQKGSGVGSALVRELERLARDSGSTEMILNSGPRYRNSGWKFFDRLGYTKRGQVRDLYGEGQHAPVWSKLL